MTANGSGAPPPVVRTSEEPRVPSSLDDFVVALTSDAFVEFCSERAHLAQADVRRRLEDYAGEVLVGVDLVGGHLQPGQRVLEVGAGLGLLSVWLVRQGVTVVMLEPGAGGFDANRRLLDAVIEWFGVELPLLSITAEQLDPRRHGHFDLIFSVNVLEHIPHLEDALDGMLGVLAPGGLMRHTCANYAVPYEPHYGIPLVPFAPAATARLVPGLARQEVWRSINFISWKRVNRYCRAHRLTCTFDRGLLARALERMDQDDAFSRRRGRFLRRAQRLARVTGLLVLLERLPPRWATPMTFTCRRAPAQERSIAQDAADRP